jgi:hypothetical protein
MVGRWLVVQLLKRSTSGGELDSSAGYCTRQNCGRSATRRMTRQKLVRAVRRTVCGERTRCRGEMSRAEAAGGISVGL